jgi:hypothetical protein
MSTGRKYLSGVWLAAAFCSLWYGVAYQSAHVLLLCVALTPSLAVFFLCMFDRADLERRIHRLEARSDFAAEKRASMQTDLTEVEHKLEQVQTKAAYNAKINATV